MQSQHTETRVLPTRCFPGPALPCGLLWASALPYSPPTRGKTWLGGPQAPPPVVVRVAYDLERSSLVPGRPLISIVS